LYLTFRPKLFYLAQHVRPIKDCKTILLPLETNIFLLTYIIISRS
jgi:hypothetical protein